MDCLETYVQEWQPRAPVHRQVWLALREWSSRSGRAVSASKIAELCEIADNAHKARTRRMIAEMIADGAPIIGTSRGYHIARDRSQLASYAESLAARGREIARRATDVRGILNRLEPLPADEGVPASYQEAVETLARWHGEDEDPPVIIYSFDDPQEQTVRLLEVSEGFPTTGEAITWAFGQSPEFPYRSEVVMVTPEEWEQIKSGGFALPPQWDPTSQAQVWPRR
jgi:hypothetical protein